jgi:putative oxidoreductase
MEYAVERNAPMPGFLVPFIGVMLFLGSLSILLGFKARLGAWLLIVILTPVTFLMHQFWNTSDVYQCMMEHFCFFKNIALIGALLMMTYFGSGPLSLDRDSQ